MKKMKSKSFYVVATTNRLNDVNIEGLYDGDVYTIDNIIEGLKKKLKNETIQVSKVIGDAYIDVIDKHDELVRTYSILKHKTFITK